MESHAGLTTLERFARAVDRPDPEIDLAEAALLIATDAYADLDVGHYLHILDEIAEPLEVRLPEGALLPDLLDALHGHLFGELGFFGNAEHYYEPQNSYLNEVLDRRRGIPISLSVVYMEVARRIRLEVVGIGLPGHFIVEARRADASALLDPFHGGESLTLEDCERLVSEVYGGTVPFAEEYLVPVTKRQILGRILNNLKMIYLNEGNAESAWPVVEKMVHLDPDSPVDRRDRGLLAHGRNLFPLARSDLRFYLDRRPDAPDRASIQASLAAVEAILSMLG